VVCERCKGAFEDVVEVFEEFVKHVTYRDYEGVYRVHLEIGDIVDDFVTTALRRIKEAREL